MTSEERGLVAITGANGTIGYACVVYALQRGYRVRCIVRREDAFDTIKTGPSVQHHLDNLDHAIVPNNAMDGAYDDALAGAKYVVHIAGAWPLPHLHPDNDIYYPFIKSTRNIIQAAENSATVQRIVFTQAGAGLVDSEVGDTYGNRMDKILDEHVQVNKAALTYHPPLNSPHQAYCAAKAQCMKYLHDLQTSNTKSFSIVQIIPGTVMGPSEFITTRAQAFKHIDRQSKALLFDDVAPRYAFGFVHVQDCAKVHIDVLDEEKAPDEDLPPWFVAAGTSKDMLSGKELWNKAADRLSSEFGKEVWEGVFKIGRSRVPINMPYRVDSRFTEKTLLDWKGMRGLEDCVRDIAKWYLSLKPT